MTIVHNINTGDWELLRSVKKRDATESPDYGVGLCPVLLRQEKWYSTGDGQAKSYYNGNKCMEVEDAYLFKDLDKFVGAKTNFFEGWAKTAVDLRGVKISYVLTSLRQFCQFLLIFAIFRLGIILLFGLVLFFLIRVSFADFLLGFCLSVFIVISMNN